MTTDAAPREQPPTEGQLRRQMEQGLKRLGLVTLGGVLTLLGVLALILTLEPSSGALKNMLAGGGVPVWVWLMVVAVYVWMIWTCAQGTLLFHAARTLLERHARVEEGRRPDLQARVCFGWGAVAMAMSIWTIWRFSEVTPQLVGLSLGLGTSH